MRKQFLTALLALACATAFAIPAKRGIWKNVVTTDGTTVRVELRGDEFCHYWQAVDGRLFTENMQTGLFEAVSADDLDKAGEQKRAAANEARARRSPVMKATIGGDHTPYIGSKKGLIILVSFADVSFQDAHTLALYDQIANTENFSNSMGFVGSVHDYFRDQSYGQFNLTFDVLGPVQMPEGYAYYGGNVNGGDNTAIIGEMVKDACRAVANEVNFADYDWDGDGEVDQVFILYAGQGEASGGDSNTIWPHEYNLRSATGSTLTLGGVTINTYACGCELGSSRTIDGIGTICHEFSHCLGLPDMYDTGASRSSTEQAFGLGCWGLMSAGNYNNNSFTPAGYTSYEKMYAGWLTPKVLEDNIQVTGMKGINDNQDVYIIYNDGYEDEYYLLENHDGSGWDAGLPGTGLLILHVDFDRMIWAYNIVNSPSQQGGQNPHQHCTLIPADNSLSGNGNSGDLWPYRSNTSLTNTTTPAAELYNANSDGSYFMNKSVRDITKNSDGTISFTFENENEAEGDYDLPQTYLFYESFDQCFGTGGNDGRFNASTTGSVVYDNAGWSSPSSRQADKCALYGSQTIAGQATTPQIQLESGVEYTLLFKAAPYTGSGTTLTLEVAEGDATLAKTSFIMKQGEWSALSTTLEGGGATKLRFKGTGRFYLDKVCVTSDTSSGITYVKTDGNGKSDGMIYDIYGRFAGKDINALPRGIYIKDGRKVVKK